MILNDREIRELVLAAQLLNPFDETHLNSFGYDISLSDEFLIPVYSSSKPTVIDPLKKGSIDYSNFKGNYCIVAPNSFILGKSVEYIRMPRNITGICLGRSSYARCGIVPNVTPLEAGWEGTITIEITNASPIPAKVHAYKGIIQVIFLLGETPERDYVQKGGRYQGQTGITPAKGL